jgi:acetoin utilization deacetylase AcuC-like enzyme
VTNEKMMVIGHWDLVLVIGHLDTVDTQYLWIGDYQWSPNMTLLYTSPIFLEHETGNHPERSERLRRITRHLEQRKLIDQCRQVPVEPASLERLSRVHSREYIAEVNEFAANHPGYIEADTVISPRSYEVAMRAAGTGCDAVTRVLKGESKNALCLVRPPGHHALEKSAMGFCLFNNIAIAARTATKEFGLDRVLIVDWDVHHGNGTQDAFWEDPQVAFFSIHRYPFYPGTGASDEVGAGKARDTKLNLPVKFGTSRPDYLARFTTQLEAFADRLKPQLVLISAGFDAHALDPIGSLGLEVEDFTELTRVVQRIANTHASGRIISMLEGGYNVDVLPLCVETHLRELLSVENAAN